MGSHSVHISDLEERAADGSWKEFALQLFLPMKLCVVPSVYSKIAFFPV